MNQLSIDQFISVYGKLPLNLRDSLFSDKTTDEMGHLQEKHNLSAEQISSLARIVGLTMLGSAPIIDFLVNIKKFVIQDEEKAKHIARDINEQIFQPVREELLQVHGIHEPTDQAQAANQVEQPVETAEYPAVQADAPPPVQVTDEAAKQKREELLARLKAAQDTPIHMQPERPHEEPEPPKAVTTAWNGKTIDLSMIPPRRQLNGNGKKEDGVGEERVVKLKKGPDGYWYEV